MTTTTTAKSFFEEGDKPTEEQFSAVIDMIGERTAVVATVSAMEALTTAQVADFGTFFLAGYASAGDGGEGALTWFASAAASANGGTVFAIGSAATGRIIRSGSKFSPQQFGGTDAAAFQAALNAVQNIVLPDATYTIDGNLTSGMENQTLEGQGWASIVSHSTTAGNLLGVSHTGFTMRDFRMNGDGTFNQSSGVANGDRRALAKVTADDFSAYGVLFNDGPQNCIHMDQMTNGIVQNCKFIGGVSAQSDTAYQAVRVTDCSDVTLDDNLAPGGSNKYVIPLFFATFSSVNANNTVTKNNVGGSFDNAIYLINAQGCVVTDNETVSDSSGVIVTGTSFVGGEVPGNIVTGNICEASVSIPAEAVGIYARDANNSIFNDNHVFGFPTSMQMSPVQHDDAGNAMSGNQICNNTLKGWTVSGIVQGKGGLNLGDSSNNKICNNTLISGTVSAASVAINATVGQQAATDIAFDNDYSNNTIIGGGNAAITAGNQQRATISGNKILNPAVSGAAQGTGIYVPDSIEMSVKDNQIKDTTNLMNSGIDGNDTCFESEFSGNVVRNAQVVPLRRLQQASSQSSFFNNRTGPSPLAQTITLGVSAATTAKNTNINVDAGYTSHVILQALNTAANALDAFAPSGDFSAATQFVIRTPSTAAGTEQYYYEIKQ